MALVRQHPPAAAGKCFRYSSSLTNDFIFFNYYNNNYQKLELGKGSWSLAWGSPAPWGAIGKVLWGGGALVCVRPRF